MKTAKLTGIMGIVIIGAAAVMAADTGDNRHNTTKATANKTDTAFVCPMADANDAADHICPMAPAKDSAKTVADRKSADMRNDVHYRCTHWTRWIPGHRGRCGWDRYREHRDMDYYNCCR